MYSMGLRTNRIYIPSSLVAEIINIEVISIHKKTASFVTAELERGSGYAHSDASKAVNMRQT
jgi:hypothetical protein